MSCAAPQLVQYQWPSWLHKQTNKQRIIWGYKILFLDVMFPLNLKRIIYIDADQVAAKPLLSSRCFQRPSRPSPIYHHSSQHVLLSTVCVVCHVVCAAGGERRCG